MINCPVMLRFQDVSFADVKEVIVADTDCAGLVPTLQELGTALGEGKQIPQLMTGPTRSTIHV